jgi:hypothetical protein
VERREGLNTPELFLAVGRRFLPSLRGSALDIGITDNRAEDRLAYVRDLWG